MKTTFLLPPAAADAVRGGEVGEVPDVLADDGGDPVEHSVLLALGGRREGVDPGNGVRAVLGDDDRRAVQAFPGAQRGKEIRFAAATGARGEPSVLTAPPSVPSGGILATLIEREVAALIARGPVPVDQDVPGQESIQGPISPK